MIQVFDGYRVAEGIIIEKGFYEDDATELHGKGQYLLENGHARKAEPGDVVINQQEAQTLSFDDYDGDIIKVHQGYRVAEGHIIDVGLYRPDDPALAGRATYLVENHYATKLVREKSVAAKPEPSPSLSELTVPKLKARAAELGIEVPSDAVKADIVALIEAATASEE